MSKPVLLILGANGFIGRNMVEYFTDSGLYEVRGAARQDADLRDPVQVERVIRGADIIIQAAAVTSGAKDIVERPYLHVTDNAVMNSVLFRAAFEARVKHVIFFSCTVMYPSSPTAVKESEDKQPLNPKYFGVASTKLYCEKLCEFFAGLGPTKFTAIRHSNAYGPHDKFDLERSHVFGATVRKVMDAEDGSGRIMVWGDGNESRDLLYVGDLTRFADLAIRMQSGNFGLYNCGSGQSVTVRELVWKIIQASGKDLALNYDFTKPTVPSHVLLDCSKAKKELGWKMEVSLDEGIKRTLAWYRSNR